MTTKWYLVDMKCKPQSQFTEWTKSVSILFLQRINTFELKFNMYTIIQKNSLLRTKIDTYFDQGKI